jgi:hypothetical protein
MIHTRLFFIYLAGIAVCCTCATIALAQGAGPFTAEPILSRPTAQSILATTLPRQTVSVFCEWGITGTALTSRSDTLAGTAGVPLSFPLNGLIADTRYEYRMRWRTVGADTFVAGPRHMFRTQRAPGKAFTFTLEADPHPYDKKGCHNLWQRSFDNQRLDSADLFIDLGDTFGDDHEPFTITENEIRQLRLDCLPFFASLCHSSPLFLCEGNHEGENGYYLLQTPPSNLAVFATRWRKYYYPNPVPDGFYSGNTESEGSGLGQPENYYAWQWGDALFVILDVYRYYTTSEKPSSWDWTIGRTQYDWLKATLEGSKARFKFVFAHHTRGQGRGGVTTARGFEWGGYDADGVTWSFPRKRPGWAMPIHQLMAANGVQIFFQGHDHLYAKEELDGVVYQEVPMPSDSTYRIGVTDNGDAYGGVILDGAGYLRVKVSPDSARVEYVRSYLPADENATQTNREVAHAYTVLPRITAVQQQADAPGTFQLDQNYPNPFNPSTTIRYTVPRSGPVSLRMYDRLGREVAVLVDGVQEQGVHTAGWNARGLASGAYFCRMTAPGVTITRSVLFVK